MELDFCLPCQIFPVTRDRYLFEVELLVAFFRQFHESFMELLENSFILILRLSLCIHPRRHLLCRLRGISAAEFLELNLGENIDLGLL